MDHAGGGWRVCSPWDCSGACRNGRGGLSGTLGAAVAGREWFVQLATIKGRAGLAVEVPACIRGKRTVIDTIAVRYRDHATTIIDTI